MKVHRFSFSSISNWAARTQNEFVLALNSTTFYFVLLNFISFLLPEFPRSSNSACLVFQPFSVLVMFSNSLLSSFTTTLLIWGYKNQRKISANKGKCSEEVWRASPNDKNHQWQRWNNKNPPVPNPVFILSPNTCTSDQVWGEICRLRKVMYINSWQNCPFSSLCQKSNIYLIYW